MPGLGQFVRLANFLQLEDFSNHRFKLPGLHQLGDLLEIRGRSSPALIARTPAALPKSGGS